MALINLGDLEREHGNFETGFVHYQKAAELPPLGDADDADGRASHSDEVQGEQGVEGEEGVEGQGQEGKAEGGEEEGEEEEEEEEEESDWFASFVVGPRLECVAQASYMSALMLHQLDRGPEVSRKE